MEQTQKQVLFFYWQNIFREKEVRFFSMSTLPVSKTYLHICDDLNEKRENELI